MSGIKYAGEYDLKEMKILTSAGNILDIKNIVQVIEILVVTQAILYILH